MRLDASSQVLEGSVQRALASGAIVCPPRRHARSLSQTQLPPPGSSLRDESVLDMRDRLFAASRLSWILGLLVCATHELSAAQEVDARALFLEHCASCHGENGDGQGTADLDRPARSFQEGGFSFGNTPDALLRTLKAGIPGTPMPSFLGTLSDDELRSLASYVRTLGPAERALDAKASRLVVGERALVARGHLGAIVPGAPKYSRGLLTGTPDGLSFEWRIDDVRLLGVRQGAFVERVDWSGRGGQALRPLGRVVYTIAGGDPAAPWEWLPSAGGGPPRIGQVAPQGVALQAVMRGSWVRAAQAGLHYELRAEVDGAAHTLAQVEDSARALGTSVGAGFRRTIRLQGMASETRRLRFQAADMAGSQVAAFASPIPTGERVGSADPGPVRWTVRRRPDGIYQIAGLHVPLESPVVVGGGGATVWLDAGGHIDGEFHISLLLATEWNEDVRQAIVAEVAP